jgi:hypothetical protein
MEQDSYAFQNLAGVVDALTLDPKCGDIAGFCMCKWTLLVMWSLDNPYLQPKGLELEPLSNIPKQLMVMLKI